MEEVVFINVQSNISRESEASTGKSDDGRLKQQGAYDNLEDSSNNKEVRSSKKRTNNNNDDENDLKLDRKKRKLTKQDSVHNGKSDESTVTHISNVDECSFTTRPKKKLAEKRPHGILENGHSGNHFLTPYCQNDSSINNSANELEQDDTNNLSGECPNNFNLTGTPSKGLNR